MSLCTISVDHYSPRARHWLKTSLEARSPVATVTHVPAALGCHAELNRVELNQLVRTKRPRYFTARGEDALRNEMRGGCRNEAF